jgi:hypothetical protein
MTMLPARAENTKYERMEETESASGRDYGRAQYYSRKESCLSLYTFYLTVSFVSGLCIAVVLSKTSVLHGMGSYESGFTTEIGMSSSRNLKEFVERGY